MTLKKHRFFAGRSVNGPRLCGGYGKSPATAFHRQFGRTWAFGKQP